MENTLSMTGMTVFADVELTTSTTGQEYSDTVAFKRFVASSRTLLYFFQQIAV